MEGEMYLGKIAGNKCYLSPIDTNDVERFNDLQIAENLTFYNEQPRGKPRGIDKV
jgi:hypothetical protein